jgi:RNA polymerase sigma factor (sigma-70 family)
MDPFREDVTVLLTELTKSGEGAPAMLVPLVYDEVRRLAGGYTRRERSDHTLQPTALDEALVFALEQSPELVKLDQCLERLAKLDPRQSKIVELRFFGGLIVEQTAEVLGISPKTVKRDGSVAKAWLRFEGQP